MTFYQQFTLLLLVIAVVLLTVIAVQIYRLTDYVTQPLDLLGG